MYKAIILSCLTIAMSCSTKKLSSEMIADTLRLPVHGIKEEFFKEVPLKYYSKFGISVPNYLRVLDSLAIDLNNDGALDTVAVFSPIVLDDEKYYEYGSGEAKRHLVEIVQNTNRPVIRGVYNNLVSDYGGVLSKFGGLELTHKGFLIMHSSGARYSWTFETELVSRDGRLYLDNVRKTCSFDGREINANFVFSDLLASQMSTVDSLKSNCNCDSWWHKLETRRE